MKYKLTDKITPKFLDELSEDKIANTWILGHLFTIEYDFSNYYRLLIHEINSAGRMKKASTDGLLRIHDLRSALFYYTADHIVTKIDKLISRGETTMPTKEQLYKAYEDKNGKYANIIHLIQEMAELTVELTKMLHGNKDEQKICEELVDVEIGLDHLKTQLDNKLIDQFRIEKWEKMKTKI